MLLKKLPQQLRANIFLPVNFFCSPQPQHSGDATAVPYAKQKYMI